MNYNEQLATQKLTFRTKRKFSVLFPISLCQYNFTKVKMFELPDKRAIVIFAVVIAAILPSILISSASPLASLLNKLSYAAIGGAGVAFTVFDIRDGYCMNRPSITRAEFPVSFWMEVAVSIGFMFVGLGKLWLSF